MSGGVGSDGSGSLRSGAGEKQAEPLTVSFPIAVGDIWADPTETCWRVKEVDDLGAGITLERVVLTTVADPHEFVRHWRKVDPSPRNPLVWSFG